MNRDIILAIAAASVLIAGAVVWSGSAVSSAIRSGPMTASTGAVTPETNLETPASPVQRSATLEQTPAGETPTAHAPVILSHDLFAKQWTEQGYAAKGNLECWGKMESPPTNVNFRVTVAASGAVESVEPEGFMKRPGSEPLERLHTCIAGMIRTMRFGSSASGATSSVQVNRE